MNIKTEQEMIDFGIATAAMCFPEHEDLARAARSVFGGHAAAVAMPSIIELIGDVGAGKTTFVRGLAKGLGIKEPVTSPSFTISKSYAFKDKDGQEKTLIHYDFYRLGDPGLMADDLADSISNPNNIVVVEWGDSIDNVLPKNRTKITIQYNEDNTREVTIL